MKDKALVIAVSYNNPILLEHVFRSYDLYDPGYECDYLVVDHHSSDLKQKYVLDKLAKKHSVALYDNNRVEVSFHKAWQENPDYKYYFFLHDDAAANRDNWLKVFIDRLNSNYAEEFIQDTDLVNLPVGRVGAMHQPWRNYSTILGHPVQCLFLEDFIKVFTNQEPPKMFKYADPDRCLVSNECLQKTNGVMNIQFFKTMKEESPSLYASLCDALNAFLKYPDEGIPPRNIYPPNECWNKFTMASEFLNSIIPLMSGYRTIGLEGDGFLEQIHGYDVPYGSNYLHHYGQPNVKEFFAKQFNTDVNEVVKHFNDKIFLLKCDKIIKDYYKENHINGSV
jgi:hypothetical protein